MTRALLAALMTVGAVVSSVGTPAAAGTSTTQAPSGRIIAKTLDGDELRLVFQADDLPAGVRLDPSSVQVQIDNVEVAAVAEPVRTDDREARIVVLAVDISRSMGQDNRLAAAKDAARTFLSLLPSDVQVGLVTFADTTRTALTPTTDRGAVVSALEALTVQTTVGTALFDGAALAADSTGDDGARSVLLLTDGNEFGNSTNTLAEAIGSTTDDGVLLDAVYIGPATGQPAELSQLVTGAGGSVISSSPADLAKVLRVKAGAISGQILILATLPPDAGDSGIVVVSAQAGTATVSDRSFASFASFDRDEGPAPPDTGPIAVPSDVRGVAALVDRSVLPVLVVVLFLGLAFASYLAVGKLDGGGRQGRLRRRLSLYSLTGRAPVKQQQATALGRSQVARSAVELAGRVVEKRDFETALAQRLEAGGVPLRAAEWMLIHIGIAISLALLLMLISAGGVLPTALGLIAGLVLPWAYLLIKESRRTTEFLAQLPDTLQLVAGSLSAGYSIPQAMDTVVTEGQQPITGEFNRALVEARLGVPIEDAMDGIAERMKSKDFAWVVMAIRIQREVGGNLAELLTTVSTTLRERERLRRQVKVLSAEGRLSAWILGLLPVAFALYLVLVRPEYLKPLVTEALGLLLLGVGVTLLAVGALWMRKAIKVEV